MPHLDIWIDLSVGVLDFYPNTKELIAARSRGKLSLSTNSPLTRMNYPAIREELHKLLDHSINEIQKNHPEGEPYVK